jgi:ketosteroid isomerase-like protein
MTEDPRDPVIRKAIASFNDADLAGLFEFIHPEVRSRVSADLGNPGSYEGIEGFGAMMADWSEAWSAQRVDLREIEHVDDRVSLVHTDQSLVGAGSGVPVEVETTFLVVFDGERAIRFEIHANRASALAAV